MENRSNYVIVGSIALAMVVGIFLMVLWLARFSGGDSKVYDVYFKQSITGLALGSPVQFNGVTVGKITQIRLLPQRPEYVRVRINIDGEVPVLEGTTAGVEGVGFTGVSQIQLDGAVQGAKPITEPLDAVTTRDRFGLVTFEAEKGGLALDIRFRMLRPRELARAQGCPVGPCRAAGRVGGGERAVTARWTGQAVRELGPSCD